MLSRQTMSNWLIRCADDWLKPIYERLKSHLCERDVLHGDETTLQVLHEQDKKAQSKSYMWLYRTSGDTDKSIVLYDYQPDRKAVHPETFLSGFTTEAKLSLVTYTPMDMTAITSCRKTSLLSVAGRTHAGNSTRR